MSEYDNATSLFEMLKGNENFYVENNYDSSKKKSNTKLKGDVYFKKLPVTEALYLSHLKGQKGLGICPINDENKCFFGVIDIDVYSGSFNTLVQVIYDNDLPLLPFRSKSGGLHIYMVMKTSVQAKSVIEALERVVEFLGLSKIYFSGGVEKVEIFPKQKKIAPDKQGSCITLPYFNSADTLQYLYDRNMNAISCDDAVEIIKRGRTSITALDTALDEVEYGDAPKCIQTIHLMKVLEKDSGRNNYLFTCAVYLQKKHEDNFELQLKEMNDAMQSPFSATEVNTIYESVKNNEYNYKCSDVPCKTYCNSAVCSKREYGVGKEKGHFSGIDYGKLVRMKTEDPYYIWELKVMGTEEYKKLIIKNELMLMDQKNFASLCIKELNYLPIRLSDNDWYRVINKVLPNIEEVEVTSESDTSDSAEIHNAFTRYLMQKQAYQNYPYQIKTGLVYLSEDKYYFMHTGFSQFLDMERIKLQSLTLREVLLSFGATEDTLVYQSKAGQEKRVTCWSKEVDDDLKNASSFYEDVYEGDAALIESSAEEKQDVPMF